MVKRTGDPNKEPGGTIEKIEDGDYAVVGIGRWITAEGENEEERIPFFKEQNGRQVVMFEFATPDGSKGPACSATPAELFVLCTAFGAKIPKIATKDKMTAKTLNLIKKAINDSGNTLIVPSSNGFTNIRQIPSAQPPDKDQYVVKFVGAHRYNWEPGNYSWERSKKTVDGKTFESSLLLFDFEIAGDRNGNPSIYDGFPVSIFVRDPYTLEQEVPSEDGSGSEVLDAYELNEPLLKCTKDGADTVDSARMFAFYQYFAPEEKDHTYESDPMNSQFGVDEIAEPQYVAIHYALENNDKHRALAYCENKKGNFVFDLMNIKGLEPEEEEQASNLIELVDYLEQVSDVTLFEQSDSDSQEIIFTDEGREWMKEHVGSEGGPWVRAGLSLEERPPLGALTEKQVTALLKELKATFGEGEAGW